MFRKVLVKLTGIFLFCISATSATPSGQPRELQNTIDDRDILATPAKYRPYLCEDPFRWVRRECVGAVSPMAWQDVCRWDSFATIYDYKPGSCPPGTTCLNTYNASGEFINCISDETGEPSAKGKDDPQVGKSDTKTGRTQLGNTQQIFSVRVDHDMTQASVAAVFESVDSTFLIAPNNVIVGNVHGYKEKVCAGDKSSPVKARECYPQGKYDFKAGQTIDFTWGMTGDQDGNLLYGILPAASVGA